MYFWMGCITELLIWLYFCWHKGYCCVRVFVRDWCVAPRWAVVYNCFMNHWTFSLDSGHTPAGVVSGIVSLCTCAVKWKKIINYICIRETNLPVTLWAELLSLSGAVDLWLVIILLITEFNPVPQRTGEAQTRLDLNHLTL